MKFAFAILLIALLVAVFLFIVYKAYTFKSETRKLQTERLWKRLRENRRKSKKSEEIEWEKRFYE